MKIECTKYLLTRNFIVPTQIVGIIDRINTNRPIVHVLSLMAVSQPPYSCEICEMTYFFSFLLPFSEGNLSSYYGLTLRLFSTLFAYFFQSSEYLITLIRVSNISITKLWYKKNCDMVRSFLCCNSQILIVSICRISTT